MKPHLGLLHTLCPVLALTEMSALSSLFGFQNQALVVAHNFNPSIWQAEAEGEPGGFLDFEAKPGL